MVLVRAGNQEAFVSIVHRYQNPLFNFFRRMGTPADQSEDLVQETFLRLYNYRSYYRPSGNFSALLYRLAYHSWVDWFRKLKNWLKFREQVRESSTEPREFELEMDIRYALEQLPENLRAVVILSVYQGITHREMAEILGIPLGTVKSRLYVAFKHLKESLYASELK